MAETTWRLVELELEKKDRRWVVSSRRTSETGKPFTDYYTTLGTIVAKFPGVVEHITEDVERVLRAEGIKKYILGRAVYTRTGERAWVVLLIG